MPEYGCALARFAQSRSEDGSTWSQELRLEVRSAFNKAMRFRAAEATAPTALKGESDHPRGGPCSSVEELRETRSLS